MSSKLKKLTTERALAELGDDSKAAQLKLVDRGLQQIETLQLPQLRYVGFQNSLGLCVASIPQYGLCGLRTSMLTGALTSAATL